MISFFHKACETKKSPFHRGLLKNISIFAEDKLIHMTISHIRTSDWALQTNEEHQEGVALLAALFADEFGMAEWGRVLGLLHDKGKEQISFPNILTKT